MYTQEVKGSKPLSPTFMTKLIILPFLILLWFENFPTSSIFIFLCLRFITIFWKQRKTKIKLVRKILILKSKTNTWRIDPYTQLLFNSKFDVAEEKKHFYIHEALLSFYQFHGASISSLVKPAVGIHPNNLACEIFSDWDRLLNWLQQRKQTLDPHFTVRYYQKWTVLLQGVLEWSSFSPDIIETATPLKQHTSTKASSCLQIQRGDALSLTSELAHMTSSDRSFLSNDENLDHRWQNRKNSIQCEQHNFQTNLLVISHF